VQTVKRATAYLAVLAGVLSTLTVLSVLAAGPASAADGTSPVSCPTGSTCLIQLQSQAGLGGGSNTLTDVTPTCTWDPVGNAQSGSQNIIDQYNGAAPPRNAPYGQYASYQQARQMLASHYTQPGEWYQLAQQAQCPTQPMWFFAVPGEVLPGGQLTGLILAQLATATLKVPGAGRMALSPKGNSYSNLPTYVQVYLSGKYQIGPGGRPYAWGTATVGNQAATVWIQAAAPLALSTNDSTATQDVSGCGYLGSTDLALAPRKVASTGANGKADCGITFHQPGPWQLTAQLNWRTCWVPEVVYGPPPAACNAVPGAELNPTVWTRTVTVDEIQAANGGG
jgi:hypothetical protein